MKIIPFNTQRQYLGLACKLSENAHILQEIYLKTFGIGTSTDRIIAMQDCCNNWDTLLVFVDEPPIQRGAETFYCMEVVGDWFSGEWWRFTLGQLVIQDNLQLKSCLTGLQAINAKIDALNAKIEALALPQRNELKYELKGLNLEIGKINRQRLIKK